MSSPRRSSRLTKGQPPARFAAPRPQSEGGESDSGASGTSDAETTITEQLINASALLSRHSSRSPAIGAGEAPASRTTSTTPPQSRAPSATPSAGSRAPSVAPHDGSRASYVFPPPGGGTTSTSLDRQSMHGFEDVDIDDRRASLLEQIDSLNERMLRQHQQLTHERECRRRLSEERDAALSESAMLREVHQRTPALTPVSGTAMTPTSASTPQPTRTTSYTVDVDVHATMDSRHHVNTKASPAAPQDFGPRTERTDRRSEDAIGAAASHYDVDGRSTQSRGVAQNVVDSRVGEEGRLGQPFGAAAQPHVDTRRSVQQLDAVASQHVAARHTEQPLGAGAPEFFTDRISSYPFHAAAPRNVDVGRTEQPRRAEVQRPNVDRRTKPFENPVASRIEDDQQFGRQIDAGGPCHAADRRMARRIVAVAETQEMSDGRSGHPFGAVARPNVDDRHSGQQLNAAALQRAAARQTEQLQRAAPQQFVSGQGSQHLLGAVAPQHPVGRMFSKPLEAVVSERHVPPSFAATAPQPYVYTHAIAQAFGAAASYPYNGSTQPHDSAVPRAYASGQFGQIGASEPQPHLAYDTHEPAAGAAAPQAYTIGHRAEAYRPQHSYASHGPMPSSSAYASQPPPNAYGPQPPPNAYASQPPRSAYVPQPPPNAYVSQPPLNAYVPQPQPNAYGLRPPLQSFGAPQFHAGPHAGAGFHAGQPDVLQNPFAYGQMQPYVQPIAQRRLHDLPSFGGRPEDWPMFSSAYRHTTAAYFYTPLENMTRLQKSLTGDARRSVECLLIHPEHAATVMQRLEALYGRSDLLVRSQIKKVRQLQSIAEDRMIDIVPFAATIQNLAMFLSTPTTQHHLSDATLLEELVRKLPLSKRVLWTTHADQLGIHPTISDFAQWATVTADAISRVSYDDFEATTTKRGGNVGQPARKRHVLLTVAEAEGEPVRRCAVCEKAHALDKCAEFARLDLKERWKVVREAEVCFACLGTEHRVGDCDRKRKCGLEGCSQWHNRLLHDKARRPDRKKPAANDQQQQPSPRTSRNPFDRQNAPGQRHKPTPAAAAIKPPTPHTSTIQVTAGQPNHASHSESNNAANPVINHCREKPRNKKYFFRIVPVTIYAGEKQVSVYAVFDEAASLSLIDAKLAEELQLEGPAQDLDVGGFNGTTCIPASQLVSIQISGDQGDATRFTLPEVQTVRDLDLPVQSFLLSELSDACPHLHGIPIEYENARPLLLIGLDNHYLGIPLDIRRGPHQRSICATRTLLGWVAYGSDHAALPSPRAVLHMRHATDKRYEQLDRLIQHHFSTEAFGTKMTEASSESTEVARAREIMAQTTRRIADRFEVGLLWRSPDSRMPDNYQMALRRLKSVEQRMVRDPEFGRLYAAQIRAFLEKGYARRLDDAEANARCERTWFLPHFAVVNANKPGKVRLVFDAAAEVAGVSLNSQLMSGPDVNVPLAKLLMQFRSGPVAMVADIREMFLQIRVRSEDQVAQRFLWRDGDSSVEPAVYVMTAVTFGATCSPALAQHVKNVNAAEFADRFPAAAEAIQTRHYVDDYVASFESAEEAASVTADVVHVHRKGGFELRGFVSNSSEALALLRAQMGSGEVDTASGEIDTGSGGERNINLQLEADVGDKVLGMCWNTNTDTFQFRTKFARVDPEILNGQRTPTKREILSVAMSVFDPFGMIADFMLESKLILQDLWRIALDWDTPVPERFARRWHAWRSEIVRTQLLSIPRCHSPHFLTSEDVQLHIFADASEAAFAACAYWRISHAAGVDLSFVLGRTRCSPLKILTVPRLELQAAVLATRLLAEIRDSHPRIPIRAVVLWSDSATVLSWLRSDQRKFKPFVQFRVAEILEGAPVECWRWVPTLMNVADDGTRVRQPPTFRADSRWTRGPEWLKLGESEWPVPERDETDGPPDELRRNFVGVTRVVRRQVFRFERFSSFKRLCRVAAWVQQYVANLRSPMSRRVTGRPDARRIELATMMLCRAVQEDAYGTEIAALRREEAIPRDSELYPLKVYLESDGLLRMYGRTDLADDDHLPFDARRPILLPRSHIFTRLLVKHQHEQMAHQLTNATIAAVRRRFWVPQIRVLVNSVRSECVVCRKRGAQPIPPVQGQLPADRLTPYVRPFTSTGLDLCGPVFVTVGRRKEKRWVAVFTCLAIRAVHLEIVADLSTDACLVAVRNFCHLRGVPSRIRCDNGTNFVGARNQLAKEDGFIDAESMQRELGAAEIEWVMNCPGNPEAGGIWERMVQAVKRILAVTLSEEAPRVETLRAHLCEAANMLNARPLTHVSISPDDDEALTPNHFLIGGPNAATMTLPDVAEPAWIRAQWRISRELSRRFWRQWVAEYLPELTRRSKNHPERKELAEGDVVIVCDANHPRGRWPMGRIVRAFRGSDGRVRTAEVRTKDGVFRRPVARLAALDLEPDNEESCGVRNVGNAPEAESSRADRGI